MGLSACASARLNRSIGGSPVVPRWRARTGAWQCAQLVVEDDRARGGIPHARMGPS